MAYRLVLSRAEAPLDAVLLEPGDAIWIGSAADCAVHLPGGCERLARLFSDAAGLLWIEDGGGTEGPIVNGQRVTRAMLLGGERLRVGDAEGTVEFTAEDMTLETLDWHSSEGESDPVAEADSDVDTLGVTIVATRRFDDPEAAFLRVEDDRGALHALYALLRKLADVRERNTLYEALATVVKARIPDVASVLVATEDAQGALAKVSYATPGALPPAHLPALSRHLLSHREALLVETRQAGGGERALLAPLWDRGTVHGLLWVKAQPDSGALPPARLDLVLLMANHAALYLSNLSMTSSVLKLNEELEKTFDRLQFANHKLKKRERNLETLVERRTMELAAAKEEAEIARGVAERAREEAERASGAKSAFLAHVSHELRTPLNAIIGYSEMLLEEATTATGPTVVDDVTRIRTAGTHLLELVDGLLDLSHVESGRMDLVMDDVEVAPLVSQCMELAAPLAKRNGNALTWTIHSDVKCVHADALKLRQTLLNLLSNACKFTDGGRIALDVRIAPQPGRTQVAGVAFAVNNTKIGMTAEQVGRLFEAFTRVHDERARRVAGTGLGLALSRGFCRLMGGDVSVQSAPGQGSTFTAWLPRGGIVRSGPSS